MGHNSLFCLMPSGCLQGSAQQLRLYVWREAVRDNKVIAHMPDGPGGSPRH